MPKSEQEGLADMMMYVKSVLVGLLTGFITLFASIVLFLVLPAFVDLARFNADVVPTGSGGIGAVSTGLSVAGIVASLILGGAAFLWGFYWQFKRNSRRAPLAP